VAFGVRRTPGSAPVARSATSGAAPLELAARFAVIVGLVALLGGAVAAAAGFGGSTRSDMRLCIAGWMVSAGGLVALMVARSRESGTSLATLLETATGRGLLRTAAALIAAGVALVIARQLPRLRRSVLAGASLAALAAMAAHVATGHAGSDPARVLFGLVHFGAAGVWVGGLAALLLGVRGNPSAQKAAAVRRFSRLAAGSLALVMITGALRAVQELPRAGDLVTSDYGQAIVVKTLLVLVAVALAWLNRTSSVPAASADLGMLRRTSRVELAAAAGALIAAGTLGSIAPPVAAHAPAPALSVSGTDAGHTVGVRLTAASRRPGPNTFVARVSDRGGHADDTRGVRLRFTALDDPDIAPTTLPLRPGPGRVFIGTGSNLRFDGRWRVDVLVDGPTGTVEVPLETTVQAPKQFLSVLRVPGRAPEYTRMVQGLGYLRVSPHRRTAGVSRVFVTAFDIFEGEAHLDRLVLTDTRGGATHPQALRRLGPGRFVADTVRGRGPSLLTVIARRTNGSRMHSTFELDMP
jgi:copper transport protein